MAFKQVKEFDEWNLTYQINNQSFKKDSFFKIRWKYRNLKKHYESLKKSSKKIINFFKIVNKVHTILKYKVLMLMMTHHHNYFKNFHMWLGHTHDCFLENEILTTASLIMLGIKLLVPSWKIYVWTLIIGAHIFWA